MLEQLNINKLQTTQLQKKNALKYLEDSIEQRRQSQQERFEEKKYKMIEFRKSIKSSPYKEALIRI